jgi:hypothetical protein
MDISTRVLSRRARALSTPRYWRTRIRTTRLREASAFAAVQSAAYVRESRSMAWLLTKSTARVTASILMAILLVAGVQGLGAYLSGIPAHAQWLPEWLSRVASWLGSAPPQGMNYQAIVAASIAIMGTLVSVYFATVAFVVSTTYKDATAGVRALVTRLPGGRLYAFIYLQAVLFGLITLALPITGREPNRLSLCAVTALGAFVVLSFGRLRGQLYGLLEPAGLLSMVQHDLARWTTQASRLVGHDPTGLRARLSRARTRQSLLTLQELCHIIRSRERKTSNVPAQYAGTDPRILSSARYVLAIWMQYARSKHLLVQLPGWCFKRHAHKDWLLTNESEIGIALATSTTLRATETDDLLWVERYLATILGELLGGRDVAQLASILDGLDDPVQVLTARGMFAESRLWMEAVVSPAMETTMAAAPQPSSSTGSTPSNGPQSRSGSDRMSGSEGYLYNLVDFIGLAYIRGVLGLHDYVKSLTVDFPSWMVAQAQGRNVRRLGPLPGNLLTNLRDALKFEKAVEGHRITSDANVQQLIARAIATETIDEATALLGAFETNFWPWVMHFIDSDTLAGGAALSRSDETLHKWERTLSALSSLFHHCEAVHRDIDDRWPDLSLDRLVAKRAALRDALRAPIAHMATRVAIDMNADRPDVFGWAFHRAHQDLLEDVLSDQTPVRSDLGERLRGLIVATHRADTRLRATVLREHDRILGSVWSEPLLTLLQLSGIALVTGLARQRADLVAVFEDAWRRLLDADPQRTLDVALAALMLDDALLGLSPGKLKRSSRHLQALATLEKIGLSRDDLEYGELEESHSAFSPMLTKMLSRVSYGDFEDVFVAAWIVPEALRRSAVLPEGGLGPRLTDLISAFADTASSEPSYPAGSNGLLDGAQGDEDDMKGS